MAPQDTGSTLEPAQLSGAEARALFRAGGWRRTTSGLADGCVLANLVVLPQSAAGDFRRFCELNPKPCPLLDVTEPGSAEPQLAAPGADLRVDLPRYRVYRGDAVPIRPGETPVFWACGVTPQAAA